MRRGPKPNLERHRQIAELRASGLTLRAIGERLGVSLQAIQQALQHTDSTHSVPVYCRQCCTVITRRRTVADNNGPLYCMACLPSDASLGQRLKARRMAAGLTLDQLATMTGLYLQALSRYERDLKEPKWCNLAKLIRVLGVDWLAVR
jgi:transcriptional regulator with XRE-family HTH domain